LSDIRFSMLRSAKSSHRATLFARSRNKSLDTSHDLCSRYLKHISKFKDGGEGRTVLCSFQQADVLRMISAFKRKRFLRQTTLLSKLTEHSCKGSLLGRALFVLSCHLQLRGSFLSINTSTKYSIPSAQYVEGWATGSAMPQAEEAP
jgi:hypothetical protein